MKAAWVAEVSEGEFIGDYQVMGVLGRGMAGTSYYVRSNVLSKDFALKTLAVNDAMPPEWLGRLEAQTAVLAKVAHPHIDTILKSGRWQEMWLCVKDLVHDGDGQPCDLARYLDRHGGRLSSFQVYHLIQQICGALSAAHGYTDLHHRGLCHGALKPGNVLMAYAADAGEDRRTVLPFEVRLTDFQPFGLFGAEQVISGFDGWKRATQRYSDLLADEAHSIGLSSIYSSFDFMAPEYELGSIPTVASDIYSVGVLTYLALTGKAPVGRFPTPSSACPGVPAAWDQIITTCLQQSARLRYESVEQLSTALTDALGVDYHQDLEAESLHIATAVPAGSEAPRERMSLTPRGMVYIPAGSFLVGHEAAGSDALPQYECHTEGFYLDRVPVTNEQFARFVNATGYVTEAEDSGGAPVWVDGHWKIVNGISWRTPTLSKLPTDFMRHPVTQVTYADVQAYCDWLDRRLPTEQEWEYAARGGQKDALYPWGNNRSTGHAHVASDGTAAVMPHPANGYGLYDMAGNVWEWTSSWYDAYPGNHASRNPHFGEKYRVLRGGCWLVDLSQCMCSYRNANQSDRCYPTVGFRTCSSWKNGSQ